LSYTGHGGGGSYSGPSGACIGYSNQGYGGYTVTTCYSVSGNFVATGEDMVCGMESSVEFGANNYGGGQSGYGSWTSYGARDVCCGGYQQVFGQNYEQSYGGGTMHQAGDAAQQPSPYGGWGHGGGRGGGY
jgi:hypothetical protein